ncbi:hypothetical protein BZJ19_16920 [Salinivibrio proteolyticus]|uniref:hypothetical protein n=1 Tax=Salinivibrio proteolyticus TaxID=334715 RepID=UPI000989496A|nr:hypothetical protein [Salinivibrio proteolyticus]OOF20861.1 hypothetical protein BZJ19_16920 [Salinivibrio proteolyticus]
MRSLSIISGDFEKTDWQIDKDNINTGLYNIQKIPFSEITSVEKEEEIDKDIYISVTVGEKSFKAKTNLKGYKEFYDIYSRMGGQPSGIDLPIKYKTKSNIAVLVIIVIVIYAIVAGDSDPDSSSTHNLTKSDKIEMCKEYIGGLFGRPPSRMSGTAVSDTAYLVSYKRKSDSKYFSYACSIDDGKMVWAAHNALGNGELGRWRFEDEVSYKTSGNRVSFTLRSKTVNINL